MLRLEQIEHGFCCPFYHILKESKFWVHNTCLTRGQTSLFASLSTKFAKTIVFIKFSVGHRSIACTPLFPLSLGICMFSFLELVAVYFRSFHELYVFLWLPMRMARIALLSWYHVATSTLCTFSRAFRGFLVNSALLSTTPFSSFFSTRVDY